MNNQGRRNCGSKSQKNKESFDMIVREVNAEFSRITKRSINDLERLAEQSTDNTMKKVTMTENEAIKELETSIDIAKMCTQNYERKNEIQGYEMAIKALEEVQQYRQIGTVEECREAVEKQTAIEPEKVNIPCTSWTKAHMRYRCSCGSFLTSYDDYCNKCGQKLKWGDGK